MTAQTPGPSGDVPPGPEADREPAASGSHETSPQDGTPLKADDLEREQLRLTNEKLKIETQKLEQDLKPERWWQKSIKNIAAFGGVIAVAASAYGLYDSYDKTIVEQKKNRLAEQHARIEEAIKRLESPSTISKLVGVSVLSGYLDASNKEAHRQVLFALAALMATEQDAQTQAAVIDLLASIPKGGPIADSDWRYFQDILLTQSRAITARNDLYNHRQFQALPLSDGERAARTVGKLIAQNIRKGVVPDYKNYRGIYCKECDFRGVTFPSGTDFTGAVLDQADFSDSSLQAALFDNTELLGTSFVQADLHGARFRSLDERIVNDASNNRSTVGRTSYLDHIVSSLDVNAYVLIRMPNFSCANLEGATFEGHALFPGIITLWRKYSKGDESKPGWYQNVTKEMKDSALSEKEFEFQPVRIVPLKLFKANIREAHFDTAQFFTVTTSDEDGFLSTKMSFATSNTVGDFTVYMGDLKDDVFKEETVDPVAAKQLSPVQVRRLFSADRIFRRRLRATFYSVEIDHALLPLALATSLKDTPPVEGDYHSSFQPRLSSALDVDWNCKPR
jgi:uncharacterized protein YjbI with pentapeptide repeats